MPFNMQKHLEVGTKVKVSTPMEVPECSTWDDDRGQICTRLKKWLHPMSHRTSDPRPGGAAARGFGIP